MKLQLLALIVFAGTAIHQSKAALVFSTGGGSAVTTVDRSANFDSLENGDSLSSYEEGHLSITTAAGIAQLDNDPFDNNPDGFREVGIGFHSAGVNEGWVTIETTDGRKITGVEFLYGNAFFVSSFGPQPSDVGNPSAIIEWRTHVDDAWVSAGSQPLGTVIGFKDLNGFDTLLVRAILEGDSINQAIALDNLKVQLAPIPEPSTWVAGVLLTLPFGVRALRRFRNRRQMV